MKFVKNYSAAFICVVTALLLPWQQTSAGNLTANDLFYPHLGIVMAKGIELNADGKPILVEVDQYGEEVTTLNYDSDAVTIMGVATYNANVQAYTALVSEQGDGIAQGHCVIRLENYGSEHCGESQVLIPAATAGDTPVYEDIVYPPITDHTIKTVVLRNTRTIADPRLLGSDGPILLKSRINLQGATEVSGRSLLLDEAGNILHTTENNIAYRSGYYQPTDELSNTQRYGILSVDGERALNPISGAKVYSSYDFSERFAAYTSENGTYRMRYILPACPCTMHDYPGDIWAEIPYKNFNPLNRDGLPFASFFTSTPSYDTCLGYHYCFLPVPYVAPPDKPVQRNDIKFDAMILTGEGSLVNSAGEPIPVGSTTAYDTQRAQFSEAAPETLLFDFDLDQVADQARLYQGEYYVYLGGRAPEIENGVPVNEDFRRLADTVNDYNDRGMLLQIGVEDLKQTDIYIYRVSTGELLIERQNLRPEEYNRFANGGAASSGESTFFYKQMMRGPRVLRGSLGNDIDRWWADSAVRLEHFDNYKADFLRFGEEVKIVAINRPTGYIGTATAVLSLSNEGGRTTLDVPIDKILLRPPNLKIRAKRSSRTELGLTAGEINEYLIGSEGAATTDDNFISIRTEWYDYDGTPLPADLPGYSGLIAKIVGDQQIALDTACTSAASATEIKPGSHFQLLRFQQDCNLAAEHYYLYVCGHNQADTAQDKCFTFNNNNALARPDYYVPVKVPLYDETASRFQYNNYRYALEAGTATEADKPDAFYRWQYRPEMQFSVYELQVEELKAVSESEVAGTDIIDLLNSETPTIGSGTDFLTLMLDLVTNSSTPLQTFGPDRELVLAVGEHEIGVTPGEDLALQLNALDHLAALQPEDYLSLRLFTNSDSANVLWEFAFEYLAVESLIIGYNNQTEDVYYVTADAPNVDLKSTLIGYAYRDPATRDPARIRWKATEDGSFFPETQVSTDFGIFDNTLILPPVKGAYTDVSVELVGSDTAAVWKRVEVLAGEPANISLSTPPGGLAVAMGQGDLRIDVLVTDQHGNPVEDGTPVDYTVDDSFIIKEQILETTNGRAHVVLTGGEFTVDDSVIKVASGSISEQTTASIYGLDVTLESTATVLNKRQQVTVSARVTKPDGSPAIDIPVSFTAVKGVFATNEALTDDTGTAVVQFTAGLNSVSDTWYAQAGYVGADELAYEVRPSVGTNIDAQDAMLVADEAQDGSIFYDLYGTSVEIAYKTQGTLTIAVPQDANAVLGDLADPNLEPLISLSMNGLANIDGELQVEDDHQLNPGKAQDVSIVFDHPLGAGRSALFEEDSRVTVASNTDFNLPNNLGTRIDLKPLGEGTVFEQSGGTQELSYAGNKIIYSVTTDVGVFSVESGFVAPNLWHRVATRVQGDELQLFVDGEIYATPITGNLSYSDTNSDIVIGGLKSVMRGFRLYDWTSSPLLSFEGGTALLDLQAGTNNIAVKSLGNLGGIYQESQLMSLRVAVISGDQLNFVSLLTKRGYQEIATSYLTSVSPETPFDIQSVHNPLGAFVDTAYAWSWDGVWDGVKTTVGLLIPYEDFITIGQQLYYLANKDWENFDPVTLAFASLGAATVIPVVKPVLKPVLVVLKPVIQAMRRFPGARHFAGAVGTAAKLGLSGKTEKILDLLPFVLMAIELYQDDEVFEFILNAIQSEDDFWVWVSYIAEVVGLEGGLDELAYQLINTSDSHMSNSMEWLIPNAYATRRQDIARSIRQSIRSITDDLVDPALARQATRAVKEIMGAMNSPQAGTNLRQILKSGQAIRYFSNLCRYGSAKVGAFIRESGNWRTNRWFVLFALGYIVEAADRPSNDPGYLELGGENNLINLIADVFSAYQWKQQGALFQLSQIVYFHVQSRFVPNQPTVMGIEMTRPAYQLVNGQVPANAKPYRRRIDILLSENGGERWVETKSLRGPFKQGWFKNTLASKSSADDSGSSTNRGYFRQYFHDMRLNTDFITTSSDKEPLVLREPGATKNVRYSWFFQKYRSRPGDAHPPTNTDISRAREWLCLTPTVANRSDFYDGNLMGSPSMVKNKCEFYARLGWISDRDTQTYVTDIIRSFAAPDKLNLESFVALIDGLGE